MMRSLILVLVVLLVGCEAEPDGVSSDAGPVDAAGLPDAGGPTTTVHTLDVDGMLREFIVYVPRDVLRPAPVVFMLHGTTGDGERFYNISGWREKADTEGIVAVFPSSLTYCYHDDENRDGDFVDPGEQKVTTKWANGRLGDPLQLPLCTPAEIAALPAGQRSLSSHGLMDDVKFFRAMLDFIAASYSVDSKRIYSTGFSNGAGMSARLALDLSDRFAAVAVAAGALALPPMPVRPLSLVFTVGNLDPGVTESLGVVSIPMQSTLLTDLPLLQTLLVDPMLTMLQLTGDSDYQENTVQGVLVSRFTWSTSQVGAANSFSAVIIEGLDHRYPNGQNHPFVMADALWGFFKNEQLP